MHASGKKHPDAVAKVKYFFKPRKSVTNLIRLTFAGINFRGLLHPQNSKDFAGIYFRRWDFQNLRDFPGSDTSYVFFLFFFVLFFFRNGKMKG